MSWLERLIYRADRQPAVSEEYHSNLAPLTVAPSLLRLSMYGDRGAAGIPAAYRGVQILEDTAAQLPWSAWLGGKRGLGPVFHEPEQMLDTPPLLADPSPYMSRDDVIRMSVGSLVWRGNLYYYLQNHDDAGYPRFATPINPDEVTVTWADRSQTTPAYSWRGRDMMPGVDILHVPMSRLPGSPLGIGPLDAAKAVLNGVVSADEYARQLFSGSAVPSGKLSVPGKITAEEAVALKAQWEDTHQGGRGTGVLSGGITYEPISMTPEQAQFLQTRAWGVQEVARVLGIPQHLLNAGQSPGSSSSLTYTNVQMVRAELTAITLYPTYLRRIEAAFTQLLPRDMEVQFDMAEMLKADDRARFEALSIAINAGIVTIPEARARENLPPLPRDAVEADWRNIAETVQKVYLGVVNGLITAEEGRALLRASGWSDLPLTAPPAPAKVTL